MTPSPRTNRYGTMRLLVCRGGAGQGTSGQGRGMRRQVLAAGQLGHRMARGWAARLVGQQQHKQAGRHEVEDAGAGGFNRSVVKDSKQYPVGPSNSMLACQSNPTQHPSWHVG